MTNLDSNDVFVLYLSVDKVCKLSGFDAGEVRTYQSNGLNIEQVTCINFEGQCSGNVDSQKMGMRQDNYHENYDYDYSFNNSTDGNDRYYYSAEEPMYYDNKEKGGEQQYYSNNYNNDDYYYYEEPREEKPKLQCTVENYAVSIEG